MLSPITIISRSSLGMFVAITKECYTASTTNYSVFTCELRDRFQRERLGTAFPELF